MTKREKIFKYIEDNGNAMRYTDIIKFAYEDAYGKNSFDKKDNRGFYSNAFHYAYRINPVTGVREKRLDIPKGHFVRHTRNGHLWKLSNGLWSVHRPLGWKPSEEPKKYSREDSYGKVSEEDYKLMCDALAKYFITPDQFDERANEYWQKGDGDVQSCYSFAFNDFLREIVKEEKAQKLEQKNYIVLNVCEGHECDICDGIMGEAELRMFFVNRDPKNYKVYEVGKEVKIEKEYSIKIKNN